ncbi:MAG: aspartate aminotransferase family protein [Bacillota bacterium]
MEGKGHVFYRAPRKKYPLAVRAEGVQIWDSEGQRYLDGASGALVVNIGHGRKEIAEVMAEQAVKLCFAHTSQFTSGPQEDLARILAEVSPGDLNRVYFLSGGSEAVEAGLKLARQYHVERGDLSRYKAIGRWVSYHGNTLGALSVGGQSPRRRMYSPLLAPFPHIPAPYCYRCPFGQEYPGCGVRCADALDDCIKREGPESVAVFVAEPVVGASGGALVPPPEYYPRVRQICDRHGVLFMADEVMTGFGRTGRMFAMEHWSVVPDMMCMGKGLGSGYTPLAGLMVRDEVHDTLLGGSGTFNHGHTYLGNPLSTAVGAAVVRIIREEGLAERAWETGAYLRSLLGALQGRHALVGDVRGLGLMLGLELVKDRKSKEPHRPELRVSQRVTEAAFRRGLIVYPGSGADGGDQGDHLLVAPPLVTTRAEALEMVSILEDAIAGVEAEAGVA